MVDFWTRPFSGFSIPRLTKKVSYDMPEKGCESIFENPAILNWVFWIPHA
jgi:hypothetical protein